MQVEMSHLTKHFGPTKAVEDYTVTLKDGELTALLGPSGCGKSTVLNMLAGILPVTSGKILFDGEDVTQLPPELRGVGLVFQNYALYPHMTVLGNICFPLEIQRVPKAERLKRAQEMASLVHVDHLLDRKPRQLSGGQQQRVAIARALVKNPNLLLLDEPLSNLDARLRLEMREEIRRIQRKTGVTTVFVTHDQEEALSISDQVCLMKDGYLIQSDLPQALYDQPNCQFVADFLGNPPINHILGTAKDGRFTPDGAGSSFALPAELAKVPSDRPLMMGLRAESGVIKNSGEGMPAVVSGVFTMGKEELATLSVAGQEIRVYMDAEQGLKEGQQVVVELKKRGVFLFDRDSGVRLS